MIKAARTKIGELECVVCRKEDTATPAKAVAIICHGFGAPSTDLVNICGEVAGESEFALDEVEYIFPSGPIKLDNYDSSAWWMIDMEKIQQLMMEGKFREFGNSSPELLPVRRDEIIAIIEDAKQRHGIGDSQIIVGGFSQGSMLSLDVALNHDSVLGGVVLWSCAFINEEKWTQQAAKQAPLKIFQSHGEIDPILPHAGAETLRDMLVENNHSVEFSSFHGQHTIGQSGIAAVNKFLDAIRSQLESSA